MILSPSSLLALTPTFHSEQGVEDVSGSAAYVRPSRRTMSVPAAAAITDVAVDGGLPQRSSRTRDERRQQRRDRQHHNKDDDDDQHTPPHKQHTSPPATSNSSSDHQPMQLSPTLDTQLAVSASSASVTVMAPCFEYLDHTADVQFHAWGDTLASAFTNLSLCLHTFMVDRPLPPAATTDCTSALPFTLTSHSLPSLLFHFLDESLYLFHTRDLLLVDAPIRQLASIEHSWLVEGDWRGVTFDGDVHGRGTEVKAITYSNMQLYVQGKRVGEEAGTGDGEEMAGAVAAAMHGADLYVIVDI